MCLLVAISAIGMGAYDNVEEDQLSVLTRVEMLQLATAVKTFHQDTGYWPRIGGKSIDANDSNEIVAADWSNNVVFDWRALITGVDDAGNSLPVWNAMTGKGWRGPYIESKMLSAVGVLWGREISADGLNSGFDDADGTDWSPDYRFRMDDLFATRYPVDDDDPDYIPPADQRAYALLTINDRNLIIAPGPNGVHDSLPIKCDSDCDDAFLENAYNLFCGRESDSSSETDPVLKEDDMVICP